MRIEIFVVRSENEDKFFLDSAKQDVIETFKGLTIIPKAEGYALNEETNEIIADNVEIWLVYSHKAEYYSKYNAKRISLDIKEATKQKEQCYAIDNYLYTV